MGEHRLVSKQKEYKQTHLQRKKKQKQKTTLKLSGKSAACFPGIPIMLHNSRAFCCRALRVDQRNRRENSVDEKNRKRNISTTVL